MRKSRFVLSVIFILLFMTPLAGYAAKINFPDIPGYQTLMCDFHMHTIFSDGQVWPTVRVEEAIREGLDAIAITDHIEYLPYEKDIPKNLDRPYEIAKESAKKGNILFPKGAEITRDTPPGHFNAIFLEDIRPIDTNDFLGAMKAAHDQNAFVFWNHPDWIVEKKGWFDIHDTLYNNKWIQGIEVANSDGYHLNGHKWCLEKNLTMIGSSDIHGPSLITETTPENHRTMTLVFAKSRTLEALKDALIKGRTAVWYKNQLIAKEEFLHAIFAASVKVTAKRQKGELKVLLDITNNCDLNIELQQTGQTDSEKLLLPAMSTTTHTIQVKKSAENIELPFVVVNMLIAPDKGLPIKLTGSI